MKNLKISFLTSMLVFCVVAASAQKKTEADVYADVPADKRERFIERLNIFFQYYRERNKNKVYDMLGEQAKQYVVGGLSRERFLKEVYLLKLKKFKSKKSESGELKKAKEPGFGLSGVVVNTVVLVRMKSYGRVWKHIGKTGTGIFLKSALRIRYTVNRKVVTKM